MLSSRKVLVSGGIWGSAQTSVGTYGVILWIIGIWYTFFFIFYEVNLSVLQEQKLKKICLTFSASNPPEGQIFFYHCVYGKLKIWVVICSIQYKQIWFRRSFWPFLTNTHWTRFYNIIGLLGYCSSILKLASCYSKFFFEKKKKIVWICQTFQGLWHPALIKEFSKNYKCQKKFLSTSAGSKGAKFLNL